MSHASFTLSFIFLLGLNFFFTISHTPSLPPRRVEQPLLTRSLATSLCSLNSASTRRSSIFYNVENRFTLLPGLAKLDLGAWVPSFSGIHQLSHGRTSQDCLTSPVAGSRRRVTQLRRSDAPEGKDGLPSGINVNPRGRNSVWWSPPYIRCRLPCFVVVYQSAGGDHPGYCLLTESHVLCIFPPALFLVDVYVPCTIYCSPTSLLLFLTL